MNIAIDGPAGAGKSTIAKLAAKELSFIYVDTGAMYRAIALFMLNNKVDVEADDALQAALNKIDIVIAHEDGAQQVYLNGENVSQTIRKEEVGNMASKVATKGPVREKLLDLQRGLAASHDVIMDGRDIGTNILPKAELKIYLTASSDVRAERRYKELAEKGETPDIAKIKEDIEARDYQDMHREIAPLKQAEDAVLIDSSHMTIDEVVEKIVGLAKSI